MNNSALLSNNKQGYLSMSKKTLILLWIGWSLALILFQAALVSRFKIEKPDRLFKWTEQLTLATNSTEKDGFFKKAFLNTHIAWDSIFYLDIALKGYKDGSIFSIYYGNPEKKIPLNYGYFPFYPALIKIFSIFLIFFGLPSMEAAILAGIIISVLGTLAAMFSLYQLSQEWLGEEGGIRTAFYFLIFPTSFFLAQVYTEGLFLGLAFSSLALARKGKLGYASVLAGLAVLTRATGILLLIPLAWNICLKENFKKIDRTLFIHLVYLLIPLIVFLFWKFSIYGINFSIIEANYFHRKLFAFEDSFREWIGILVSLFWGKLSPLKMFYYSLELASVMIAITASIKLYRRYPEIVLFGLFSLFIPLTTGAGSVLSIQRYILTVPVIFIWLGSLGKNYLFDRLWCLGSILLMGMLATLFSFGMWVA